MHRWGEILLVHAVGHCTEYRASYKRASLYITTNQTHLQQVTERPATMNMAIRSRAEESSPNYHVRNHRLLLYLNIYALCPNTPSFYTG